MKEEYFNRVILDITNLCEDLLSGHNCDKKKLFEYLNNLTDTSLNTICALMDFGRAFSYRTLPINLEKFFNTYYLTYWFDANEKADKNSTASYLAAKYSVLPRYLNRAQTLLFESKHLNIALEHECGGLLCLEESDPIVQYDHHEYELNLKCVKCKMPVKKIVHEDFLEKGI